MQNPFRFGGVIGQSSFCNRVEELKELERYIVNCHKVFLYSERRFGKTSLVKLLLQRLDKEKFSSIYIDLWPTGSNTEFTNALAAEMTKNFLGVGEKVADGAKRLFAKTKYSIGADGMPSVTFDPTQTVAQDKAIEEILSAPQKAAERTRKTVVVVLDEIQQIMCYGSDSVEKHLRSAIQTQGNVAYIFLGSRKHLMKELILNESRPLYKAGSHFPLKAISSEHWIPFIQERFLGAKKNFAKAEIEYLLSFSEGQPNTTQQFCYELWERAAPNSTISEAQVLEIVNLVVEREANSQGASWRDLSKNEQDMLKKLALNEEVEERETLDKLYQKDLVDFDWKQRPYIVDRIQKRWIRGNIQ